MNKEGLDYNTQREKLVMPEYGREIQQMVDYCVQLEDRNERQHCAEAIIAIMDRMFPENRGVENHEQKLWDHLAITQKAKDRSLRSGLGDNAPIFGIRPA